MARRISQKAFDLCLSHEVTSKAYYEKHLMRPEWPGLQSGVTVAIGYDLGQASRQKIVTDWQGLVSGDMLLIMASCAGITGNAAKAKCAEVRNKISIPWAAAIQVFAQRDVPTWTAEVIRRVPGTDRLTPTMLGVLFDLAYNRGHSWSMSGDRYAEMRAIKAHVGAGNLNLVPGEIIRMKRLWANKGVPGLLRRCDERAALWRWALANSASDVEMGNLQATPSVAVVIPPAPAEPDPAVPMNAGPARTKPPATSTAQNTTAATIAAGAAAGAAQAHAAGAVDLSTAIGLAVAGVLVAGAVWAVWFRSRNPD